MIEEILPNLWKNEIPLPNNPLRAVNSYLIKGSGRFLIIDTGMNRDECRREMLSNLAKLDVDLSKTDFFITHLHADHLGLVANLASDTSTVYFNRPEAAFINLGMQWQEHRDFFYSNGFPEDELKKAIESHPGHRYGSKDQVDFNILEEGDMIEIGDYRFRCIETPGHSPGHMCLYEADQKLLICGDHILSDITPNISLWFDEKNTLKEYMASLDKVYPLEVNLVLPGHRHIFKDHRKRIIELKEHHETRANEILPILDGGGKNAFQIASLMSWDIDCDSWEQFPSPQKWFAFMETLAHLKYLEENKAIQKRTKGNRTVYSLE